MVASGNGHTAFMRFLLDEGCDPCVSGESGQFKMVARTDFCLGYSEMFELELWFHQ